MLSVGKDALMRVTSNPFYDYMQARIDSRISAEKSDGLRAALIY